MKEVLKQGKRVWWYVIWKTTHNSLPFFAVLAAVGNLLSPPVLVLLMSIGTGVIVDLSFFYALRDRDGS